MTQHADDLIDAGWAVQWTSPVRGQWTADRHGRAVGAVRRDGNAYVAKRGRRTIGTFRSLDAALDAVEPAGSTSQPARLWTALLVTANVGMLAALAMVASALLR